MPSNILLNTQSAVGYNNKLKKASFHMKFAVNKSVNLDMKSVGVKHMNGGSSKRKTPTSHLSNQKTASEAQKTDPNKTLVKTKASSDSETNND